MAVTKSVMDDPWSEERGLLIGGGPSRKRSLVRKLVVGGALVFSLALLATASIGSSHSEFTELVSKEKLQERLDAFESKQRSLLEEIEQTTESIKTTADRASKNEKATKAMEDELHSTNEKIGQQEDKIRSLTDQAMKSIQAQDKAATMAEELALSKQASNSSKMAKDISASTHSLRELAQVQRQRLEHLQREGNRLDSLIWDLQDKLRGLNDKHVALASHIALTKKELVVLAPGPSSSPPATTAAAATTTTKRSKKLAAASVSSAASLPSKTTLTSTAAAASPSASSDALSSRTASDDGGGDGDTGLLDAETNSLALGGDEPPAPHFPAGLGY